MSYALPEQLHATASVASTSASIATAHTPAVGLGLRGVRVNSIGALVARVLARCCWFWPEEVCFWVCCDCPAG